MSFLANEVLLALGWNEKLDAIYRTLNEGVPARVIGEEKNLFRVQAPHAVLWGEVSGRFRFQSSERVSYPATGDWVVCEPLQGSDRAVIHHLLPRTSCLMRKQAGGLEAQILAANVDTVFLTTSANEDLNPRRLERYLTLVWESGATPVIVLTKADLSLDLEGAIASVAEVAAGANVHAVSVVSGAGIAELAPYFAGNKTVVLLGSSGVGKSTLANHYLGTARLKTQEIRAKEDRGRHTTTSRYLFLLPEGGMIIDTPGMRELGLMDHEAGLSASFEDIESIAAHCRFGDCQHRTEPGCQVKASLEDGSLPWERWESYEKLLREMRFHRMKTDKAFASETRKRWKQAAKSLRSLKK